MENVNAVVFNTNRLVVARETDLPGGYLIGIAPIDSPVHGHMAVVYGLVTPSHHASANAEAMEFLRAVDDECQISLSEEFQRAWDYMPKE